jgi:hypothetical protein
MKATKADVGAGKITINRIVQISPNCTLESVFFHNSIYFQPNFAIKKKSSKI